MVEWLGRLQDHEIADYSSLVLLDVPQKLDPSARLQILRDLGSVDADNAAIERLAAEFVTAARRHGSPPDRAWVGRELRGEVQTRGKCVKQGADLDAALAREFNAVSH